MVPGESTGIITADTKHPVGDRMPREGGSIVSEAMQSPTVGSEAPSRPVAEAHKVSSEVISGASGGASKPVRVDNNIGTAKVPKIDTVQDAEGIQVSLDGAKPTPFTIKKVASMSWRGTGFPNQNKTESWGDMLKAMKSGDVDDQTRLN